MKTLNQITGDVGSKRSLIFAAVICAMVGIVLLYLSTLSAQIVLMGEPSIHFNSPDFILSFLSNIKFGFSLIFLFFAALGSAIAIILAVIMGRKSTKQRSH